jgi:hypothetical protein
MKLVIVADIHGNHDALRALPEDYDGCCHGNHIRPREDCKSHLRFRPP